MHAETLFERADGLADRRWRDSELGGGGPEAALLGYAKESSQSGQVISHCLASLHAACTFDNFSREGSRRRFPRAGEREREKCGRDGPSATGRALHSRRAPRFVRRTPSNEQEWWKER